MAFTPAQSGAITAAGGQVNSTVLPQIITGSPEQILAHVAQLLGKAAQFAATLEQLKSAADQLKQAWPNGTASADGVAYTAHVVGFIVGALLALPLRSRAMARDRPA